MAKRIDKTAAPSFIYNNQAVEVQYSFAEYTATSRWNNTHKVWLDILFVHPLSSEVANIRVAKSSLLLCQPKEVIEAIIHREIREFLTAPFPVSGPAAHADAAMANAIY